MEINRVFLQIGEMMIEGKNDPLVDEFAKEVKNVSGNLSDNLLWKVANSVTYVKDIKEYWQSPAQTLEKGQGDCEDFTILLGSAALRLGILTRYKVVSTNGETWDHIYPLLYEASNKRWYAADATLDNIRLGRECQHLTEVTFGVNGGVYQLGSYIQYSSFEWLFALAITIVAMIAIVIHR